MLLLESCQPWGESEPDCGAAALLRGLRSLKHSLPCSLRLGDGPELALFKPGVGLQIPAYSPGQAVLQYSLMLWICRAGVSLGVSILRD